MRIAILGLGAMGSRMARRLLAAGHEVVVYNRNSQRATDLVASGAVLAPSPRQAVRGASVVLSMVRDDAASADIWAAAQTGALHGLEPGALAIESSTLTHTWSLRWHTMVAQRGGQALDAPVLGSRPQAEAGALIFLVGGEQSVLESARTVISGLGTIVYVGAAGQGAALKLLANALFSIQAVAMSEFLQLATQAGLDLKSVLGLLEHLPVISVAARNLAGLMVNGRHDPMFPIDLVVKDLQYAKQLTHAAPQAPELAMVDGALSQFQQAQAGGFGAYNISAISVAQKAPSGG